MEDHIIAVEGTRFLSTTAGEHPVSKPSYAIVMLLFRDKTFFRKFVERYTPGTYKGHRDTDVCIEVYLSTKHFQNLHMMEEDVRTMALDCGASERELNNLFFTHAKETTLPDDLIKDLSDEDYGICWEIDRQAPAPETESYAPRHVWAAMRSFLSDPTMKKVLHSQPQPQPAIPSLSRGSVAPIYIIGGNVNITDIHDNTNPTIK